MAWYQEIFDVVLETPRFALDTPGLSARHTHPVRRFARPGECSNKRRHAFVSALQQGVLHEGTPSPGCPQTPAAQFFLVRCHASFVINKLSDPGLALDTPGSVSDTPRQNLRRGRQKSTSPEGSLFQKPICVSTDAAKTDFPFQHSGVAPRSSKC